MARSSARDEADCALSLGGAAGDEIGVEVHLDEVVVGQGEPFEGFAHDGVNIVDELLHDASLHIAHLYLSA